MNSQERGDGRTYLRGRIWWIQYNHRGRTFRESSKSEDEKAAKRLLKQRSAESATGKVLGVIAERVTLGEMKAALIAKAQKKKNRSIGATVRAADRLIAYFGESERALDITADRIDSYIAARRSEFINRGGEQTHPADASINRELAALRRMFRVMVDSKKLSHDHVPKIELLPESEPRKGFVEPAEFARLREELPDYLRGPISFLYATGWRKGAMRSLQWARDVELKIDASGTITGGAITLQSEFAKNKEPQTLPITGAVLEIIRQAWSNRAADCPFVFQHQGAELGDFRKAWKTAAKAAGLGGLLIHDLRRSCVRNLIRAGVSQTVAMRITGHLTPSMFRRYNITSQEDLSAALAASAAYTNERATEQPKVVPMSRRVA